MNKRLEATVSGRVQMVMFRDFTKRTARKLGLVGFVKNQIDGTVLVVAEGEESALKKLISHLHKGSLLSKVKKVDILETEATGMYTRFSINY